MSATKIRQPKLVNPARSMEQPMRKLPKRSRFADFSAENFEREKLGIEKEIAARLTRGNIPTQQGHFITQRDLDAMRDEMETELKSTKSAA